MTVTTTVLWREFQVLCGDCESSVLSRDYAVTSMLKYYSGKLTR